MKTCIAKDELEKYLTGWTDEAHCSAIENHLAQCPQCERTVTQLESETNTGLARLVSLATHPSGADELAPAGSSETENQTQMAATLDPIRQWNGSVAPLASVRSEMDVESLNESPACLIDGVLGNFGQYEICELIGRGGMAEVYRARHKRLNRDVAIKLLRVPQSQIRESLERIEREIRAVGRLKHPAIVSAVDAGEQDGIQYLATEFIDGLDLGKIARAISPMPVAEACEMIRQAALGLDYAHANGIIHRDIKPSNLMLEQNGVVKILDFGLVRLDECSGVPAELTSVGQLLGTLDYMAPEQADRADSVDHRSDIYSLGATLFRLLAGRAPYAATAHQSPLEKLRLLALDQPPHIRTLRPDLPEELAEIVDQTLSRDPAQRPSSAAHLAEKLEPFCAGANVATLITQARAADAAKPEEKQAGVGDGLASMNSFRAGQAGSIMTQAPIKPANLNAGGSFKRIRRWLIGLGFTAAAVVAGIVLVLETQKGKVVIETDSPNVHVSLVAEDGKSQDVRIVPGKNETRVYAGRYEIRIDDGTDSYTLDKNAFILNRGETVVAKVRVDEEAGKADVEWSENSRAYQAAQPSADQDSETWLPITNAPKRMAVYQTDEDAEFLARVVEAVLEGKPDSRLEIDAARNRLVVYAPEWVHRELQQVMKDLAVSNPSVNRLSPDSGDSTGSVATEAENTKQPAPMLTEPVFEGHGISYWLNRGEYETDGNIIQKAQFAIDTLSGTHASAREQARSYLVSKPLSLDPSKMFWFWHVAKNAGLDDKQAEALLKEIQSGSRDSAKAALWMLSQDAVYRMQQQEERDRPKLMDAIEIISSRADFQNETSLAEFAGIIGSNLNDLSRSRSQLQSTYLHRELNKKVHQESMQKIMDTPWLGPVVVLKISKFRNFANTKIVQTAFLSSMNSAGLDESELTNLLTQVNEYYDSLQHPSTPYKTDKEFNQQLLESLDQKLKQLVAASDLSTYRFVGNHERVGSIPNWGNLGKLLNGFRRPDNDGEFNNNVLAILATMESLLEKSERQPPLPGVAELLKATQTQRDELYKRFEEKLAENGNRSHHLAYDYDDDTKQQILWFKFPKENQSKTNQLQYDRIDLPVSEQMFGAAIIHEAASGLIKRMEARFSEANPVKAEY